MHSRLPPGSEVVDLGPEPGTGAIVARVVIVASVGEGNALRTSQAASSKTVVADDREPSARTGDNSRVRTIRFLEGAHYWAPGVNFPVSGPNLVFEEAP
jgi:hypothetical protein